jgi:hypothetical protein
MRFFLPSPIALISAVLLYGLLLGCGAVSVAALPYLFDLLRTAPHLAMLGLLGLAVLPGLVIVVVHHLGSDRLTQLERLTASRKPQPLPTVESWSAGAHGWLVLYGSSLLTSLVMLVFDPPKLEPESFDVQSMVMRLAAVHLASLETLVWILVATTFFEIHRRAHRRPMV